MADTWPYPLTFKKEQAHYPIIQEPTSPWYLLEVPNEPFLEINSAQNLHWPLGEREPPPPLHDSHKQMPFVVGRSRVAFRIRGTILSNSANVLQMVE